jgi:ABC-type bacteriocin/lantibiotic exporter with double-glycine peptidase domain
MSTYKNLLKIKPFIIKSKFYLILAISGMILASIIYMPVPYLTGYTIDKILLPHKSIFDLYKIVFLLSILYLLRYIITIISKNLFIKVQTQIVNTIRLSMIGKIINLPMSFLNKNEKGYILSRISESDNIGNLFSPILINIFLGIFDLIFALIMMFNLNYKLTLIVILIIPIYFKSVKSSSKKLFESTKLMLESGAVLSGETYEVLNGIEEIKILNGLKNQVKKFKKKLSEVVKNTIKQSKQIILFTENITLVNNLAGVLILLFAGIFILNDTLSIGIYTAFIVYMNKVFVSTSSFASFDMTIKPVCVAIERVQEFLEMEEENQHAIKSLNKNINKIAIKDVSFKYENTEKYTLKNVNFDINEGDRILIQGLNGTGKSTLIKMFLGLYYPTEGQILINNEDYLSIDSSTIRNKVGVISQNIFLFRGTVLENILYGNINNTELDVLSLIENYGLNDYIKSFPEGLKTKIEQNGIGISGGQTQIIAFLRATIAKKNILILDEATSNIDIETKKIIINLIQNRNLSSIIIIISHQENKLNFINKTLNLNK